MRTLIKNGMVLTLDQADHIHEQSDVLIEGDTIAQIGRDLDARLIAADKVINASDKLVMPGLINGHLHSWNFYLKGSYDDIPLDVLVPYLRSITTQPRSYREDYVRTVHSALEMLKGGITTAQDNLNLAPLHGESLDAVMRGYADVGMRAMVGMSLINTRHIDSVPYLSEILPTEISQKLQAAPVAKTQDLVAACQDFVRRWKGREACLHVILTPSGPQRCTDDLLLAIDELSRSENLPWQTHTLETKSQALMGLQLYGTSIIAHLDQLGLLSTRLTLAHCVWTTEEDIGLLARAGTSVVHNPASNLKLGSGLAPIKKMLEAGVNVALGCDGGASNDGQNMFESMKLAALLAELGGTSCGEWEPALAVLRMATRGGARSNLLDSLVGSLEVGKKADIILLDLRSPSFTPVNDAIRQLVYCERGDSVDTVIVNGRVVIEARRSTLVDESAIVEESREFAHEFRDYVRRSVPQAEQMRPYAEKAYWACMAQPLGFTTLYSPLEHRGS